MSIRNMSKKKLILYAILIAVLTAVLVFACLFLVTAINRNSGNYDKDVVSGNTITLTNEYNEQSLIVKMKHYYNEKNNEVFFLNSSELDQFIALIKEKDSSYKIINYNYNYLEINHPNGEYYQLKRKQLDVDNRYGMGFTTNIDVECLLSGEIVERSETLLIPIPIGYFSLTTDDYYRGNTLSILYSEINYNVTATIDQFLQFYSRFNNISAVKQDNSLFITNTLRGSKIVLELAFSDSPDGAYITPLIK